MAEIQLDDVTRDVRDLFNKGFAAFERGNLDYAIDLLFSCVEKEPRLLQARRFLRAAEFQKRRQKKDALLNRVASMITGLPAYLNTMKEAKTGSPEKALVSAERLLRYDPLNIEFVRIFVKAAASANLPEAAIQTLEMARDVYPENISILNQLGVLYHKTGRTSSARECFEKLCEICPNDPDAMKKLKDAMALDSMQGDGWSEAAEKGQTFREIIKDTKQAVLLEQGSKAVKTEKDTDALIEETVKKVEAEPENINYYRALSKLYSQKKMFDEAVATLSKALELSPGDPELDKALTETRIDQFDDDISKFEEAGDSDGAEAKRAEKEQFVFDDMQERVKRYPNDLVLRFDWGVMLLKHDYVNEAIQQFQLSQKNPKYRIRTLYNLAMCFKRKEQYDLALEQLARAASEIPSMDATKKDILYELGEIAEILGDRVKAAEYYKQIYQVDIGYKDIAGKVEKAYQDDSR